MKKQTVKLRKWLAISVLAAFCLVVFTACAQPGLSGDFDEAAVKSAANEVVEAVNSKNSDKLREMSNETMKAALTDEALDSVYQAIAEGGSFQKITDLSVAGASDKETKEEYAVAVAKAEYESKSFVYTISFSKDMKMAGLYYK